MGIGVGKAEVYEFYSVALESDQNVGRLEVAVEHLLGVHIRQGVAQLVDYAVFEFGRVAFGGNQFFQGAAVYPLHLYAASKVRYGLERVVLADVLVVKRKPYLELFAEQALIDGVAAKLPLETFQHPEASQAVDAPQLAVSRF